MPVTCRNDVVGKVGASTGEGMVVLITRESFFPERERMVEEIRQTLK